MPLGKEEMLQPDENEALNHQTSLFNVVQSKFMQWDSVSNAKHRGKKLWIMH